MHASKPTDEIPVSTPSWDGLYDRATGQSGYFTVQQAAEAGFSDQLLHKHTNAGHLERARRGVYRIIRFPPSEQEDLVVFWLWSGRTAVFSHETALQLHGLSDALPARIHLTLPAVDARRRRRMPEEIVPHFADVPERDRAWFGPIPVTTPARTVVDVAEAHGDATLVAQAIEQGIRANLFPIVAVASAAAYVASFEVGFATRARPLPELGDQFIARPVSGTCGTRPPADWPRLAEEVGGKYGGRLRAAEVQLSRAMYLEYAWAPEKAPTEVTFAELRAEVAGRFGWK